MRSFFEAWRRHLWLWVLPLGFCVLNLLAVAFYSSSFAGQVERLESRYQATSDTLTEIQDEQRLIEEFMERIESHRAQVASLHYETFQTEEQRLTKVLPEIKRLARQAGLRPTSLSYPRKRIPGHDLVRRDVSFTVQGTYDQLRTFINFLELTDHFIMLNSVSLSGGGEGRGNPPLRIKLVLSTIFTSRDPAAETLPAEVGEEPET
jgi:Tfp pilus assembly protein PilO